jgi:hypothetical protein
MQDDDVYRFVVLRGRAPREPAPPSDPLIPAYSSHANASTAFFRDSVAAALGFGDVWQARWSADQLLSGLRVASAWALLTSLPVNVRPFFSALPRWARGRDRAAAESALLTAFSVTTAADLRMHHQAVVDQRSALADYLGACSLLAKERGDIDGAAHLICCCETTERLMLRFGEPEPNDEIVEVPQAGDEDGVCWLRRLRQWLRPEQPRAALTLPLPLPSEPVLDWTVPLNLGMVTLPFVVGDTIEEDLQRRRLASAGAAAMDIDTLMPRKFPSFEGDLIVLKQQIRRYELGEIAHVENVLAGETASRIYRNLRRTETRVLTQQEVETETTRDLQATTRDELRQEISRAMSEQRDLSANFAVTASYMGPGITVTASAGAAASYRRASEERNTTASEHAHEVVTKTSERVRERVLTQREAIESEEKEETARHEWKNDSEESIVGVYRWLERQFDLQLVNYGRRTIYEFTVPEPAAYWLALT